MANRTPERSVHFSLLDLAKVMLHNEKELVKPFN